jgi:hypothetical protein
MQVVTEPPLPIIERLQIWKQRGLAAIKNSRLLRSVIARIIIAVICIEVIVFFFVYYYCYRFVHPGSKPAANINASHDAFNVFKWILSALVLWFNVAIVLSLILPTCGGGPGMATKAIKLYALALATVLLTSWGFWLSWPLEMLWHNAVWNDACQGHNIMAVLQGVNATSFNSSLPVIGVATVFLEHGNYTMQLVRQNTSTHDVYHFYVLDALDVTPPVSNITYNTTNTTFWINQSANQYALDPLSFPSLRLELDEPSIPFSTADGSWPPSANIVRRNVSTVSNILDTVTLSPADCT